MKHYAGIDVSLNKINLCIVDQKGRVIIERELQHDHKVIDIAVRTSDLEVERIGIETGTGCRHLVKKLRKCGHNVVYLDARKMSALLKVKPNKTDRNDARAIADAVRAEIYREVHIKSDEAADIQSFLTGRRKLINIRIQSSNGLRALFKEHGVRLGSAGKESFADLARAHAYLLPLSTRVIVESLVRMYETAHNQLKEANATLRGMAQCNEQARLLMTMPGIGPVTALQFLVDLDDPTRFGHSRSVGAYVGLTPRQYSSGEQMNQGRISKCGPAALRTNLVEAAVVLLTRSKKRSRLQAWGLRLKRRMGLKKASVAVARKMSVILHQMLLSSEPFSAQGREHHLKKAA